MSMLIELTANGRKTGHICNRNYRRGNGCPLLVRTTSEDVMVANVFGTLRHLRPSLWLRPMLNTAFATRRFSSCSMKRLRIDFWHPVPPPPTRAHIEGATEVDMLIRFGDASVFVEMKYNAQLSTRTQHDENRDQLARLLDVAWSKTVSDQLIPQQPPLVLVVGVPLEPPELVMRYRDEANVRRALAHHERFPDFAEMTRALAQRVNYLSWRQLSAILVEKTIYSRHAEQPFLGEVITYLNHKIETASQRVTQRRLPVLHADQPERAVGHWSQS